MSRSRLTPAQVPAWTTWKHFPDRMLESSLMRVEWLAGIDPGTFRAAFDHVVATNDSLRLVFGEDDDGPWQSVLEPETLGETLDYRDFSGEPDAARAANDWLDTVQGRPFDLSARCFTAALAKVSEARFLFQVNAHHAASDHRSKSLLIGRLDAAYRAFLGGGPPPASPQPSFIEHIRAAPQTWRPARAEGGQGARISPLAPHDPGSLRQPKEVVRRMQHLGPDRARLIRRLAGVDDATPGARSNTDVLDVFLAVTAVLLTRLSGESMATIGTMSHGRYDKASRDVMGQFVRLVPVTFDLDDSWRWDNLIKAMRAARYGAFRRSLKGQEIVSPMITTSVNFIPEALPDFAGVRSTTLHGPLAPGVIGRDFNLRVETPDVEGDYKLVLRLARDLDGILGGLDLFTLWGRVLEGLAAGQSLDEIALGGPEEMAAARAAAEAAATAPAPDHMTLVSAFLAQADARPNAIALRDGDAEVTFAELADQSRRIAMALRARGVRDGDLVAMILPRSALLIAALLGVLRAGAGYYSVDTRLPAQRMAETLAQTDAPVVIHARGASPSGVGALPTVDVETLLDEGAGVGDETLPAIEPRAPMYVMFTSGSTGTPKGVLVPHESFMRYQNWAISVLTDGMGGPIDWALSTSLAFESAYRSFVTLQTGGTMHCYDAPDNVTGMSAIEALEDDVCDGIALTPSHLRLLLTRTWKTRRLKSIISIGEPLPLDLARRVSAAFPDVRLLNFYGPTESTMAVTAHRFDLDTDRTATVPIGHPPPDAAVHVVDAHLRPVPRSIPGELVVGGQRLSLGYMNRPDLTARAFLADPFRAEGTIYRTGDLGFVDARGNLVHLGRNDHQLKINGLRVETGDVETAVARHADVQDCAVIAVGGAADGNPGETVKLVAFYVASSDIETSAMRRAAAQTLARALLPRAYFRVGRIPHTQSGKTDRRALAALVQEGDLVASAGLGEAPKGRAERALASVWRRILGQDSLSREDDFFELGGDSLSFVNMVLSLEAEFDTQIPLDALGAATTLADVARFLPADALPADTPSDEAPADAAVARPSGVRMARRAARRVLAATGLHQPGQMVGELDINASFADLTRRLMLAGRDWPGRQLGRTVPVVGQNLKGRKLPLVWCFNGRHEAEALGGLLAPDRPLFALRSMQAIVERGAARQIHRTRLVQTYADEIERILPDGPYLIGGNCQAGRIATELALELKDRGNTVVRLCLLEYVPPVDLPLEVSLFFGRDSEGYNPFLTDTAPQETWKRRFAGVTWDIVPGRHGQYFGPGRVEELSAKLENRLPASVQAGALTSRF